MKGKKKKLFKEIWGYVIAGTIALSLLYFISGSASHNQAKKIYAADFYIVNADKTKRKMFAYDFPAGVENKDMLIKAINEYSYWKDKQGIYIDIYYVPRPLEVKNEQ